MLLAAAVCSHAETAYVIDKLLVGVHKEKSIDSEIVKVLPTGTPVEVLERDGELARIKEPDGETGWVDAGYLMSEQPAALLLEDLEKKNKELAEALRQARAGTTAEPGEEPGRHGEAALEGPEELEALRKERDELKQRLASVRLHNGELQARISELSNVATPADGRELQRLREENETLRRQLGKAGANGGEHGPDTAAESELGMVVRKLLRSKTLAFSLLGLLVLAFGGGVYFMDHLNRRRHGGFRL